MLWSNQNEKTYPAHRQKPNPPHGSVEIVQVLATKERPTKYNASRGEQWDALSKLGYQTIQVVFRAKR